MNKILNRIIKNLQKPHQIPLKIFSKLEYLYNLKKYDQNIFENEQNNTFNLLSLNRIGGIENLNLVKKDLNLETYSKREMSSEHEVLFSSISINKNLKINNILEIGTYDGFNALLLSKLFPNAKLYEVRIRKMTGLKNSTTRQAYLKLKDGSFSGIQCYKYGKEDNLATKRKDVLRVNLFKKKYNYWLVNVAFK